jgi:hypothetical protein
MAIAEAPVRPRSQSSQSHSGPFVNEPFYDFRQEDNARKMRAAIERVRGQLGREYDLIIGGQHVKTADKITSLNPSRPSQIVGLHQKAGKEHVEPAIKAALKAFESWKYTSVEERASLLFRVADRMRERKMDYMAWLVFEVSKNWGEADADISETIDFCEFYAREALRFAQSKPPVQMPGERDSLHYIPLGVGAVIPPWNFPCAIMAGMTLASIVSGNTVILKPSSDSPTIAAKFVELLEEVGIPAPASAMPSSLTPKPVTSPSPARAKSACTSIKLPPRKLPARFGSSAPSLKWVARTRLLLTPTPISTPPSKGSPRPRLASRARSAPPVHALSSTSGFTTSSLNNSKPA